MTGMGFAAVARVTEDRWITCQSLDLVGFGLKPGDELPVKSTICDEIRGHRMPVVINDVDDDPQYHDHHTPKTYGLKSYISVPIILGDGRFFVTLCAIDTRAAKINHPLVLGTFKLFSELIGQHLDTRDHLKRTESLLVQEREMSELREQFIAVLGHDLRNPIAAVDAGTTRLLREGWTPRTPAVLQLMKASISRMAGLVDNVMDLARARMGDGIVLEPTYADLGAIITQVTEELRTAHPSARIRLDLNLDIPLLIDGQRMAQMFSNLISNAVTHGSADSPILISGTLEGRYIEVKVSNSGSPIPPSQIDTIFQPYRRGQSSAQGLGLGLYIAAQIAKAHGGALSVTSHQNETCFTFRMPVRERQIA